MAKRYLSLFSDVFLYICVSVYGLLPGTGLNSHATKNWLHKSLSSIKFMIWRPIHNFNTVQHWTVAVWRDRTAYTLALPILHVIISDILNTARCRWSWWSPCRCQPRCEATSMRKYDKYTWVWQRCTGVSCVKNDNYMQMKSPTSSIGATYHWVYCYCCCCIHPRTQSTDTFASMPTAHLSSTRSRTGIGKILGESWRLRRGTGRLQSLPILLSELKNAIIFYNKWNIHIIITLLTLSFTSHLEKYKILISSRNRILSFLWCNRLVS